MNNDRHGKSGICAHGLIDKAEGSWAKPGSDRRHPPSCIGLLLFRRVFELLSQLHGMNGKVYRQTVTGRTKHCFRDESERQINLAKTVFARV
jgi:hypothetical protein